MSFGGFGGEGYEFESRPEVDAWLRSQAGEAPAAATRFEVLDGEPSALVTPSPAHAACAVRVAGLLNEAVGDWGVVSAQEAVRLNEHSQPCPDVAVLASSDGGYDGVFVSVAQVLLMVEVADTPFGLTHSRGRKASYYARCGIAECWIVDLTSQQVLLHRSPASGGYRDIRNLRSGSTLTIASLPGLAIPAGAVLEGNGTESG